MKPIKLGILQTNHDKSEEVGDKFPDDAHRFRDLFDCQEQRYKYRIYMTIGGEVPQDVEEQDAYMITGSPLSVLDDHVFSESLNEFIRKCDQAKKPLLGVCFGHQAIAQALGGKVERSKLGYNVGIETARYHTQKPWMQPPQSNLPLYVFHNDQVTSLPDGCEVLASTDKCEISSFSKGDHIFTTQSHPEFTSEFMSCVLKFTEKKMPNDDVERAWQSLAKEQEGHIFGAWATEFFKRGMKHV